MVITNVNQVVYQGDGVTTAFPFTFRIIDATDIKLLLLDSDGTETDITSDYFVDTENNTVHYPGYAPGAEPALSDRPPVLAEGQKLVIYRKLPITQEKDLGDKWPFYVIELALDKLTMILQDIWDWCGRCLCVSKGQAYEAGDAFDPTIPLEAGKVICGNENGTGFEAREALMEVNGAWDGEGRQMSNVATPGKVKDAATKEYVDNLIDKLSVEADRYIVFNTVAAMVVADLPAGYDTRTLGYHDINDGGAGVYSIRGKVAGETEDGGSVIFLANGNVAELITDGTVNVKQFGAYGDLVHDDTIAFKNATAYTEKTWNGSIADHPLPHILAPYGKYLLTDTWKISYPCTIDVIGDLVYNGEHDRSCVEIGGVVSANYMLGSHFRFQTIAELSAYNTSNWEGGTRYFSNDNFVGLKTINLGFCKIEFAGIVNFAVGFVALAKNAGWYFNEVVGKIIRNCQESFRIESYGSGWPNGNKVSDIYFHVSSTISDNTSYNFYNIRVVHSGSSTYLLNSWVFENLRFESHSTGNFTCIYLQCCRNFSFNNYRAEVYNKASTNFCVIDLDTNYTNCLSIVFNTKKLDYGAINFLNLTQNATNALYDICHKASSVWEELSYDGIDEFKENLKQITENRALSKKYRYISNYGNDYTGMSPVIPCGDPVTNSDGVDATNLCILISVPKVNTSFKIECFGSISIKGLDDSFQSIDLGEANNATALLGISGDFRMVRPYGDNRFLYMPQNNNVTSYYFSVINPNIKYIALNVNKQNVRYKYIRFFSDNSEANVLYSIDGNNKYISDTVPTSITDWNVGETILKANSATNEYWQLEKQADNSLAWTIH